MNRPKKIQSFLRTALVVVFVFGVAGMASACPSCKQSLAAGDPQHQSLVAGYYYSILFMMSMPFVLLTSFSGYMYFEVRRARAKNAQQTAANPVNKPHFLN